MVPADDIGSIEFAPGSKLLEIANWAFQKCFRLTSVCIPASVVTLGGCSFSPGLDVSAALGSVTFEAGSKLKTIEARAFDGCWRLHSIYLPASVEVIKGTGFSDCGLSRVEFESGNCSFRIDGDFILDFDGRCVVDCFGHDTEATIPDRIEKIDPSAFASNQGVVSVRFGRASQLAAIASDAFEGCVHLGIVTIPSSVRELGGAAFCGRWALCRVVFESPSEM
jgi:hypothetical protein